MSIRFMDAAMAKCVVFDLDGTLVDSVPDLTASLKRLMSARGLPSPDQIAVTAMVGDGAKALLDRAFSAIGAAQDAAALPDFLADYTGNAAVLTRPYSGAEETLEALRAAGWTLALCTNKPELPALALLEALDLRKYFTAIGGGDSFPVRKPDPGHLLATLAAACGDPEKAVMIGDHHNDIDAGRGAGVRTIWARWGYGRNVEGWDASAGGLDEVAGIVAGLGIK
jgi:phosphoglycolate phosphatase